MSEVEKIKDKNYEFYINADLSEYAGKWIAIVGGKVVASGDRADEVYEEAKRKYPNKTIAIDKVPENNLMVL
jgi:ABC-type hemin transport system ATPase subunit